MTDSAAKVEVQHLVAARETIAFLRDIDWSASSEDWKYARVAEIIARHAPAPDLTTHLAKYRDAMDAIYNDSEAGRELVTKHFGLTHPVVEPDAHASEWEQAIKKVERARTAWLEQHGVPFRQSLPTLPKLLENCLTLCADRCLGIDHFQIELPNGSVAPSQNSALVRFRLQQVKLLSVLVNSHKGLRLDGFGDFEGERVRPVVELLGLLLGLFALLELGSDGALFFGELTH